MRAPKDFVIILDTTALEMKILFCHHFIIGVVKGKRTEYVD
jgi:hypothetical protein